MSAVEERVQRLLAEEAAQALKTVLVEMHHHHVVGVPENSTISLRVTNADDKRLNVWLRLVAGVWTQERSIILDLNPNVQVNPIEILWNTVGDMAVDLLLDLKVTMPVGRIKKEIARA